MKRIVTLLLFLSALSAHAQGEMEILHLKHRASAEVVEALRPLLEKDGSISGVQDKVIIRASARNRTELRKALAAIDTPPRQLRITVLQDNDFAGDSAGADARRARVWSSRGSAADRASQQVQVIEGGAAFIQLGYSLPIPLRQVAIGPRGAIVSEAVVYRDIGTGFHARPRVSGERVTVDISPQQESFSATEPGAVRSARLSTTVTGRLGEWMELGAANQDVSAERSGIARYSHARQPRRAARAAQGRGGTLTNAGFVDWLEPTPRRQSWFRPVAMRFGKWSGQSRPCLGDDYRGPVRPLRMR